MDPTKDTSSPPHSDAATDPRDQVFRTDHLRSDLKRRSVKGGVDTLAAQGVKTVVQILSIAILARILEDTDFGKFAKVVAVVGLASLFQDVGLSMATVQARDINHRQVSTLFWINVLISVVLALVGCALAPVLVWFYDDPDTFWLTIALSSFIAFGGLTMQHLAILRRQMRFRVVAAVDVVSVVSGLVLAVLAALAGWGYWALVVQQGTHHVLALFGMWSASRWVPCLPSRHAGVGGMVRFGAYFAGSNVANYGANNIDKIVLGRFFGDALVGQYRNAFALLMMPVQQMLFPISNVAISVLSRTVDDEQRFRRAFLGALENIAIVTIPLFACSIACADWLIRILLGPGWERATQLFLILGFASLLQPITNGTTWALISHGRTDTLFRIRLLYFASVGVAVLAGVPFGVEGVAFAYVLAVTLVRLPIQIYSTARHTPVRATRIYASFMLYLVATLLALGAAWIFRTQLELANPFLGIALTVPVLGATYLAIISLFPRGRAGLRAILDIADHIIRKRSIPKPT